MILNDGAGAYGRESRVPFYRAIQLGLLLLFGCFGILGGCEDRCEVAVREAAAKLGPEHFEAFSFVFREQSVETCVAKTLAPYSAPQVLAAIMRLYERSADVEGKARALAVLRILASQPAAATLRPSIAEVARQAVASANDFLAFHGLRVYGISSTGSPDDARFLTERLSKARSEALLTAGYEVLLKWGGYETILPALSAPPDSRDGEAYATWYFRANSAMAACIRSMAWHGEGLPAFLGARLLELMRADPHMIRPVSRTLVSLRARDQLPEMRTIYMARDRGAEKTYIGSAILVLKPGDVQIRKEVVQFLRAWANGEEGWAPFCETMPDIMWWLSDVAACPDAAGYTQEIWQAIRKADTVQRAEWLKVLLLDRSSNESAVLDLLESFDDDDMRGLLSACRPLRELLGRGLFGDLSGIVFPRQGSPSRARLEARLKVLLESTDMPGR